MPKTNDSETNEDFMLTMALAHLNILYQVANGAYKPKNGEVENRYSWLVGYLATGEGLTSETNKALGEVVSQALSQSGLLNTQSDELKEAI